MGSEDAIISITSSIVRKRLPRELRLGHFRLAERIYLVIRIETAAGLVGFSYSQTRGAPVAEVIHRLLAPVLLGADSTSVVGRWEDCHRATIATGRTGLIMRGLSLVDNALWDIQSKRAGLPLYKLLGGVTNSVPAIHVAGYPIDVADVSETVDAALDAADAGHSLVKIARSPDRDVTRRVARELDERLPDSTQLIVDAAWAWASALEGAAEIASWPKDRLAWVEDPFPPEALPPFLKLATHVGVPLAAGDEVTDPTTLVNLAESGALDVLRLDVATVGGITAAMRVLHRAESLRMPVSFHICPEISAHVAAASSSGHSVETFDRTGNRFDPSHELFEGGPKLIAGSFVISDEPGTGLRPVFTDAEEIISLL